MTSVKSASMTGRRLTKTLFWFALGSIAFYLIGFVWKGALDRQQHWPIVEARVETAEVDVHREAEGVDSQGTLTVSMSYESEPGKRRNARMQLTGRLKQLREQQTADFPTGAIIQVRIHPDYPAKAVTARQSSGMLWIVAGVAALFCVLNGLTALFRPAPAAETGLSGR